jgi:hypothetical protein
VLAQCHHLCLLSRLLLLDLRQVTLLL